MKFDTKNYIISAIKKDFGAPTSEVASLSGISATGLLMMPNTNRNRRWKQNQ